MLTYSFADLQGESMYTHLYKCIKKDIAAGTLKAKEKLPSKRTLAKNLGISLITVENAYAQLLVEGYIYSELSENIFIHSREYNARMSLKAFELKRLVESCFGNITRCGAN